MKKLMISVMILTMAAAFSFADEGEQEPPSTQAEAREQVREQVQAPAPDEVQEPAPDEAQEQETAEKIVKKVTLRTGTSNSLTGKVDSVKPADPLTRPRSSIVIIDSAGEAVEFVVKALAVVYDRAGRFLSLDDVRPEQEVQVDYTKKPGKVKEAVSIKILK